MRSSLCDCLFNSIASGVHRVAAGDGPLGPFSWCPGTEQGVPLRTQTHRVPFVVRENDYVRSIDSYTLLVSVLLLLAHCLLLVLMSVCECLFICLIYALFCLRSTGQRCEQQSRKHSLRIAHTPVTRCHTLTNTNSASAVKAGRVCCCSCARLREMCARTNREKRQPHCHCSLTAQLAPEGDSCWRWLELSVAGAAHGPPIYASVCISVIRVVMYK